MPSSLFSFASRLRDLDSLEEIRLDADLSLVDAALVSFVLLAVSLLVLALLPDMELVIFCSFMVSFLCSDARCSFWATTEI